MSFRQVRPVFGSLVSPGKMDERAHQQEPRQHGHNRISQRAHLAITVDQGRLNVAEPVLSVVAVQGHGKFVVVPAEAGIVEIDDMQTMLADHQVGGMQVRVYQAECPGIRVPGAIAPRRSLDRPLAITSRCALLICGSLQN